MEELRQLDDFIGLLLVFAIRFVGLVILMLTNSGGFINKALLEIQIVEWVWTITPAALLLQIALSSLVVLYLLDESACSSLTTKVVGHQIYWSYEYEDLRSGPRGLSFDSYNIPTVELGAGIGRPLEVDNWKIIVFNCQLWTLVFSLDAIHSWRAPVIRAKAEAAPGRSIQAKIETQRPRGFMGNVLKFGVTVITGSCLFY